MTTQHRPLRLRAQRALSVLGLSAVLLASAGSAFATPSPPLYVTTAGSDANPGSQASPFLTIQAAINAANPGDTIIIDDGTYTGPGDVDLDTGGKNLTIQSVHGAASTVIDCGGSSSVDHRGFIIQSGETVSITGLTIKNGYESSARGGAIDSLLGDLALANCIISGNTASDGGGIANDHNFGGSITLTNCLVFGNTASNNGGGVFNETYNGSLTLTNCTFSANTASGSGGGIGNNQYRGSVTLTNSIFYGDTATNTAEIYSNIGTSLALISCDVQGGYPGTGNIDSDPLFVSATDFHLLPGSPALGTGDSTGAPATDIEGTTRPTLPSMGAYDVEVAPVTVTSLTVTPNTSSVVVGGTQQFTATATYSDQTTADVTAQATWVSDNTSAATIDAQGLAIGVAAGTSNINATYSGYFSTTAVLTVAAASIPAHWDAISISVAPDNMTHILWNNPAGRMALWSYNTATDQFFDREFGPYPGWKPTAVADGPDGKTRVLWNNTSGRVALWDYDIATTTGTGQLVDHEYGPYPGWSATAISVGTDNTTHILWNNTSGRVALWNYDTVTSQFVDNEYGPYPGWKATAVADGPDGKTRIVWNNTSGRVALWDMNTSTGQFTDHEYGPYPGWSATAVSVAPDNTTHILWNNTSGRVALWNYDTATSQFVDNEVDPAAGWTAKAIADGPDGQSRVLGTTASGAMTVWDTSSLLSSQPQPVFGPYAP